MKELERIRQINDELRQMRIKHTALMAERNKLRVEAATKLAADRYKVGIGSRLQVRGEVLTVDRLELWGKDVGAVCGIRTVKLWADKWQLV